MADGFVASQLILALLWEGEKQIPFHFDEPLRSALESAITKLYQEQHSGGIEKQIKENYLISDYQPPELGRLLSQIVLGQRNINPWDYFDAARGSWWEGGPLKPKSVPSVNQLKADLRQHFGDAYEMLVQHFVPHFQRLVQDYR